MPTIKQISEMTFAELGQYLKDSEILQEFYASEQASEEHEGRLDYDVQLASDFRSE